VRHVIHAGLPTELTLLYGAMDVSELLFREALEAKARTHPNLRIVFYLNNVRRTAGPLPPLSPMRMRVTWVSRLTLLRGRGDVQPPPGWTGGVGFLNEQVLRQYLPPATDDGVKIVLCGPPGMCKALKPVLQGPLGYSAEQFFSFM
jgi:NAD(P)H-flavin reductase